MPVMNNLKNIKVSSVFNNGFINFGDSLLKGMTANQEGVGGYTIIGDLSIGGNKEGNYVSDPDVIDQLNVQL